MKRIRAHVLLFASLACLAPAVAVAKTPRSAAVKPARAEKVAKVQVPPSLPDRNPLRLTTPAPAPAQDAAQDVPAAPESSPSIASDATVETGTVPSPERNPAAAPGEALPLPDRNPSSSVAMTPPAAVPLAAVTPQSDMAKSTSVVPLPEHNPQTPTLLATPPLAAPAPAPAASP